MIIPATALERLLMTPVVCTLAVAVHRQAGSPLSMMAANITLKKSIRTVKKSNAQKVMLEATKLIILSGAMVLVM